MKHVIWTNNFSNEDFQNWKEDMKDEYPDSSDEDLWRLMLETNDFYMEDERENLNKELPYQIICIADLGLWNGRVKAYKEIGHNLKDCLYSDPDCDYVDWYVEDGDFKCDGIHHDGTNHYLYRRWKPGITERKKNNFANSLAKKGSDINFLNRYTKPLGPEICKIYGWEA